ncbi:MAG: site-specific integrase [Firmicutes bacterium]|nr:site-specific integrase [Bacillota bacterium]
MPYLKEGTIRKRKDGRWETRAMLENRKQGQTAIGRNQLEVISKHYTRLKERDERIAQGRPIIEKLTLFGLLDKWYELEIQPRIHHERKKQKGKINESTAKGYRNAIKYHIKVHFEDKPLESLTALDLHEGSMKVEYSRTRENVDNTLFMALTWAYKMELTQKNVVQHFKKHKHEREAGIPFTRKDQERILAYAKDHSKYYFHFMTYFNTGARPGELLEIRHCDFDFVGRTIFIDGTKTKTSSRRIPLFKPMYEFMDCIVAGSQDKVFTCTVNWLRMELKRILIALGIASETEISDNDEDTSKYALKSTRHSFGTRLREDGIDIKVISRWMGHSNLAMTDHYSHVLDEFEHQQAAKVGLKTA